MSVVHIRELPEKDKVVTSDFLVVEDNLDTRKIKISTLYNTFSSGVDEIKADVNNQLQVIRETEYQNSLKEAERITAEKIRQTNENKRELEEQNRQNNESIRINKERNRQSEENKRVYNENKRLSNESDRQTAESERIKSELSRLSSEEIRIENEKNRQIKENERITAESTRETNETSRKEEEAKRQTAESDRATAEIDRNIAEDIRIENETARVNAESDRATAETTRVEHETARVNAEAERQTAESGRITAETTRDTNETVRVNAESDRVTAEATRNAAEDIRIENENIRIENEKNRQTAESTRITAESTRETNETARVNAEAERVEKFTESITNANTATDRANTAAKNAEDATIGIVNIIDDDIISTTKTYSSDKISKVINTEVSSIIDDTKENNDKSYSSKKINTIINDIIDDSNVTQNTSYSSQKINTILQDTKTDIVTNGVNKANVLSNKRKINGTNFDGSSDVTTTSWGSKRNISIIGDLISQQVQIDGSQNINIPISRKYALAKTSSTTTSNTWYKIASCTLSEGSSNNILFYVTRNNLLGESDNIYGFLNMIISYQDKLNNEFSLNWIHKSENIDVSEFMISSISSGDNIIFSMWVQITNPNISYKFTVLSQDNDIILYNDIEPINEILDTYKSPSIYLSLTDTLRTPRKINGTNFDGSSDITTTSWGVKTSLNIFGDANLKITDIDGSKEIFGEIIRKSTSVERVNSMNQWINIGSFPTLNLQYGEKHQLVLHICNFYNDEVDTEFGLLNIDIYNDYGTIRKRIDWEIKSDLNINDFCLTDSQDNSFTYFWIRMDSGTKYQIDVIGETHYNYDTNVSWELGKDPFITIDSFDGFDDAKNLINSVYNRSFGGSSVYFGSSLPADAPKGSILFVTE